MLMLRFRTIAYALILTCSYTVIMSYVAPLNLLEPYNILVRPKLDPCATWTWAFFTEGQLYSQAYGWHGNQANALTIWHCDQNALAMLDGFGTNSRISQKRMQIDADDDGTRGHFAVRGNLDVNFSSAISCYWHCCGNWTLSAHLPFFVMSLNNVSFIDLTKNITIEDMLVQELLTSQLGTVVHTLGNGLFLGGWKRAGIGDITTFTEWSAEFPQAKPLLKKVRLALRAGLSIPTGLKEDENLLVAFPFGNDRTGSIIGGVTLDLLLGKHLRLGLDVQLTHFFGNTRIRRIKTDPLQTDLLLLEKNKAYLDYGLEQEFNLFLECVDLIPYTSLLVGYEYRKQGDKTISLFTNAFSAQVANTAPSLFDWTIHQMVINAAFDGKEWCNASSYAIPSLSLYARLPFNGVRSIGTGMLGVCFNLRF